MKILYFPIKVFIHFLFNIPSTLFCLFLNKAQQSSPASKLQAHQRLHFISSNQIINILGGNNSIQKMVKTFQLLQACLTGTQVFLNRILSLFRSILPTGRSKMAATTLLKKRKHISKREVRAIARAKLTRKRRYDLAHEYEGSKYETEAGKNDQVNEEEEMERLSIEEIDAKFAQFIKKNEEELICSVCRSIILLPAITECSHIFCLECIENSLIISNKCPLCRGAIATEQSYGIHRLKAIQSIIDIKNIQKDDRDSLIRMQEHQIWKNNRFIDTDSLNQGLKVDIWKIDAKQWKKGQINIVYEDQNEMPTSVLVTFDNLAKDHNEIIEIPTFRLAKYNFYSKKYESDEFTFPELHFRHSNRINMDFDFSFVPPLRRTFHQHFSPERRHTSMRFGTLLRRTLVPVANLPQISNRISFEDHSNEEQTQSRSNNVSRINHLDNQSSEPASELFRLQLLGPDGPPAPERNDTREIDLLPNLNPGNEFRREALSSSEDGDDLEDLQMFEINDF